MTSRAAQSPPVFILGAGRCGSRTVAQLLSAVPGCHIVHERSPKLLAEARDYMRGSITHDDMVALLRQTRPPQDTDRWLMWGESNQRLSFVLPALRDAFPGARYLWLLRDGRDNVASLLHRGWYYRDELHRRHSSLRPWIESRLQADELGEMSGTQWARCDPFARCCWYWAYTNRLIEQHAAELDLCIMRVRLEQLDDRLGAIMNFLDLPIAVAPRLVPRLNVSERHALRPFAAPMHWRRWSPRQRAMFQDLAGDVMGRHYPGAMDEMHMTAWQDLAGAGYRAARSTYALAASATRPLRLRIGLARAFDKAA